MSLEQELGRILRERGLTVAVAESITGGMVGDLITNVPGSSSYFEGAMTTYSNRSKARLLCVEGSTLDKYGAVSEQCAREMALGVHDIFGVDIGMSVTGIAGPGGGSAEKPVGLVYFGVTNGHTVRTDRKVFVGDRAAIKRSSAEHLIEMAVLFLEKEQ